MKSLILIITFLVASMAGCVSFVERDHSSSTQPANDHSLPLDLPQTNTSSKVDILALGNAPPESFDKQYGKARKTTKITESPNLMPGEYREYAVEGNPKGLSVRFYKNRAKRFNLILGTPADSANRELTRTFGVDVSKLENVNIDPLSETWKGTTNGLSFRTIYAKRKLPQGKFVMLHAEIK